jgi:amidase
MPAPSDLSAVEARRLIGSKELSPVELLESCLARIEETNRSVNAMVAVDMVAARRCAQSAEGAQRRGEELGPLGGLPIGVKDLQATAGLATTFGSLLFKDHVPTEDDHSVANIRRAGGIILGKTNTPEFGAGGNTTNRLFGPTGNPFEPTKTSGGSSGGSAAALALGQVPLATGSDYGGSLRTPAAFCGVVGFRPSPGIIPDTNRPVGLLPFHVLGPMGRSVEDAHLLLLAQMGQDKRDPFSSLDNARIPTQLEGADLSRLRAAVSTDLGCGPIDRRIATVFRERVQQFKHHFREVQERAPDMSNVHEVFETLRGLQFVAAYGDVLKKHRDLLGRNAIDNIERGLKLSVTDIGRAYVEQASLTRRFLDFFQEVDLLICPAAAVSPFPNEQLFVEEINGERMETYMRWLAIVYATTMALSCVAVVPCGRDHMGMPFGIQIIGPAGSDTSVLEIAYALEQVLRINRITV